MADKESTYSDEKLASELVRLDSILSRKPQSISTIDSRKAVQAEIERRAQ